VKAILAYMIWDGRVLTGDPVGKLGEVGGVGSCWCGVESGIVVRHSL